MAEATRVGVGTGSTTTPTWPVGSAEGDLGILAIESSNENRTTPPTGWLEIPRCTFGLGTAGSTTGLGIQVYFKWHNGAESNPSLAGSPVVADHRYGVIVAYRNVSRKIPIEAIAVLSASGGTVYTMPSVDTSSTNSRVLMIGSSARDVNGAWAVWGTNANLSGFAEFFDNGVNTATGGGISMADGVDLAPGTIGTTTITQTVTMNRLGVVLALRSADHDTADADPLMVDDFSGDLSAYASVGSEVSINGSDQLSIVNTSNYANSRIQETALGPLDDTQLGPLEIISYPAVTAGSREHWFYVEGSSSNQRAGFIQTNNPYVLRLLLFNNSATETSQDIPYSANQIRWWRLIETGGTLHWQVNPSLTQEFWCTVRSMATPAWMATADFQQYITAAYWGSETAGQLFVVDNLGDDMTLVTSVIHDSGPLSLSGESDATGAGVVRQSSGALAASGESNVTGFGVVRRSSGPLSASAESNFTGAGRQAVGSGPMALSGESSFTGTGRHVMGSGALSASAESDFTGAGDVITAPVVHDSGPLDLAAESSFRGEGTIVPPTGTNFDEAVMDNDPRFHWKLGEPFAAAGGQRIEDRMKAYPYDLNADWYEVGANLVGAGNGSDTSAMDNVGLGIWDDLGYNAGELYPEYNFDEDGFAMSVYRTFPSWASASKNPFALQSGTWTSGGKVGFYELSGDTSATVLQGFIWDALGNYITVESPVTIAHSTPHRYTLSYDNVALELNLLLDGVLVDTAAVPNGVGDGIILQPVMGGDWGGASRAYGTTDEARIYRHPLVEADDLAEYMAGLAAGETHDSGPLTLSGETTADGAGRLLASSGPLSASGESSVSGAGVVKSTSGALGLSAESSFAGFGVRRMGSGLLVASAESSFNGAGVARLRSGPLDLSGMSIWSGSGSLTSDDGQILDSGALGLSGDGTAVGLGTLLAGSSHSAWTALAGFEGAGAALPGSGPLGWEAASSWAGAGNLHYYLGILEISAQSSLTGGGTLLIASGLLDLSGESDFSGAGLILITEPTYPPATGGRLARGSHRIVGTTRGRIVS